MNADLFDRLRLFRGGGGGSNEGSVNRRSESRSPPDPERSRIKRALFGPVDHDANRRFVEEELAKSQREMSTRYNYDFSNDRPLEGRWKWERFGLPSSQSTDASVSAASANSRVSDTTEEQKENSGVNSLNPATALPVPAATTAQPLAASASLSAASVPSASTSTTTNSSFPCDIPTSVSESNTSSSSRSSSKTRSSSSQKSSVTTRHQSKKITGTYF